MFIGIKLTWASIPFNNFTKSLAASKLSLLSLAKAYSNEIIEDCETLDELTNYVNKLSNKNNLTNKERLVLENLNSEIFVNKYITDGAVVNINSYELKLYSNAVLAKKAFFDGITIYTKDGAITDNATKKTLVNISDIDFVTKGIYHFSITVTVDGKSVVMHYSLQIV